MRRVLAAAAGAALENGRRGGPRAFGVAGCAAFAVRLPAGAAEGAGRRTAARDRPMLVREGAMRAGRSGRRRASA
jgi:hypothetical protein